MSSSPVPSHIRFTKCILELIRNSLEANATCIAIRIHARYRQIRVIDNGIGMSESQLRNIGESSSQTYSTLAEIQRLSETVIITTRHIRSSKTYIKIFEQDKPIQIYETEHRPSSGSTITIYGFFDVLLDSWALSFVCFIIANIALNNPQTSFSIRDDERSNLTLAISKPRNPARILRTLYGREISPENLWIVRSKKRSEVKFIGYIGLTHTSPATQTLFLNNRPIEHPFLLDYISTCFVDRIVLKQKLCHKPVKNSVFLLFHINSVELNILFKKKTIPMIIPEYRRFLMEVRQSITRIMAVSGASGLRKNNSLRENLLRKKMEFHMKGDETNSKCTVTNKDQIQSTRTRLRIVREKVVKKELIRRVEKCSDENKVGSFQEFAPLVTSTVKSVSPKNTNIKRVSSEAKNNLNLTREIKHDWNYKEQIMKSEEKCEKINSESKMIDLSEYFKLITPKTQKITSVTENFTLSLSYLSEWSYHSKKNWENQDAGNRNENPSNSNQPELFKRPKRFDFLPQNLNHLVPNATKKLTTTKLFIDSNESIFFAKKKYGLKVSERLNHQELDVRKCAKKFCEFHLDKASLETIKLLGQINNEFIIGTICQENSKILILLDQHAVHERIRYENLLNHYKRQASNSMLCVKLREPIELELPFHLCNSLSSKKMLLWKYGLQYVIKNSTTILVYKVPECVKKNKNHFDDPKLRSNVYNLITEILEIGDGSCSSPQRNLPITIHNAIAMEACHGAIRFGDRLTMEECESLIELLKRTKSPTRCAHGRPSVIPLLQLPDSKNIQEKAMQV